MQSNGDERNFLIEYYRICRQKVAGNKYLELFADEKIRHSFQVVGCGNYIMRHEEVFHRQPPEFIKYGYETCLLHDIGRFREIELKNEHGLNHSCDHSQLSYEILSEYPQFAVPEILLPVKHHGHMIEELYRDADYLRLPPLLQEDVEHLAFLVRDADKIANLYLMKNVSRKSPEILHHLFLYHSEDKRLTPEILESFLSGRLSDRTKLKTASDWLLNYLAWFYDINYLASFDFCSKTGCLRNLLNLLSEYIDSPADYQKIENCILHFITRKYQQKKG